MSVRLAVARDAGLDEDTIGDVFTGSTDDLQADHRAALALADALMTQPSSLSDEMVAELHRLFTAEQIIERGENDDLYDQLLYESADSYSQLRLIYLQNRRFELGSDAGPATEAPAGIEYIDPYEGLQ